MPTHCKKCEICGRWMHYTKLTKNRCVPAEPEERAEESSE